MDLTFRVTWDEWGVESTRIGMEGVWYRCGYDNVRINAVKTVNRNWLLFHKQGIEHGIKVKESKTIVKGRIMWIAGIRLNLVRISQRWMTIYPNSFGDLISLWREWFPIDRLCNGLGTTEIWETLSYLSGWRSYRNFLHQNRMILAYWNNHKSHRSRIKWDNHITVRGYFNWVTSGILVS